MLNQFIARPVMAALLALAAMTPGCHDRDGGLGGIEPEKFGNVTTTTTQPPIIRAVTPNTGFTSSRVGITITGITITETGFRGGYGPSVTVELGGTAMTLTAWEGLGFTTVYGDTPAHLAGPVDVVVTSADGQVARLAGGFTYIPIESVNFNGDWEGMYFNDGLETGLFMRFTIQNNALTSISCGSSPTLTLAPAAPVINGAFSFSGADGVAVSGRFVSTFEAEGMINWQPWCPTEYWGEATQVSGVRSAHLAPQARPSPGVSRASPYRARPSARTQSR